MWRKKLYKCWSAKTKLKREMEFTFDKETITATLKVAKGIESCGLVEYVWICHIRSFFPCLLQKAKRYCGLCWDHLACWTQMHGGCCSCCKATKWWVVENKKYKDWKNQSRWVQNQPSCPHSWLLLLLSRRVRRGLKFEPVCCWAIFWFWNCR